MGVLPKDGVVHHSGRDEQDIPPFELIAARAHHITLQVALAEQVHFKKRMGVELHGGRVGVKTIAQLDLAGLHLLPGIEAHGADGTFHGGPPDLRLQYPKIDIYKIYKKNKR